MATVPLLVPRTEPAPAPPKPAALSRVPVVPAAVPAGRRHVRIAVLVPILAACTLAVAVTSSALLSERDARTLLAGEIETRLLIQARLLAATGSQAMLDPFPELTLQPLIRDILAEHKELGIAMVVDDRGIVHGHPQAQLVGHPGPPPPKSSKRVTGVDLKRGERIGSDGADVWVEVPVMHGSGRRLGTAFVSMHNDYLAQALKGIRERQIVLLAVVLLIGSVLVGAITALLLRPVTTLRDGLERIGRGDLETPVVVSSRTEFGLLADEVNRMTSRLRAAQSEAIEQQRMRNELSIARGIQSSLIPERPVECGPFLLRGYHQPAAEVGGDYFDLLPDANGQVGVAIADVAGKGLGGCLVMSMMSSLLRALRGTHESPAALLAALDRNLRPSMGEASFISAFYGVLDGGTHRLCFASAGHLPSLVYRARTRSIERIRSAGVPLAAAQHAVVARLLADEFVDLGPGDLLLQYTDGINEARETRGGEQFGIDRMEEVMLRTAPGGPEAVIGGLLGAVEGWSGSATPGDDLTLLTIWHRPATPPAAGVAATAGCACLPENADRARERVSDAQARGQRLDLDGGLESLGQLRAWIRQSPAVVVCDPETRFHVESALYELCANILEHGQHGDERPGLAVYWSAAEPCRDSSAHRAEPAGAGPGARHPGTYLVVDRAQPFDTTRTVQVDFDDAAVRLKGRGLGLSMVQHLPLAIRYFPATPIGNITCVAIPDEPPAKARNQGAPS